MKRIKNHRIYDTETATELGYNTYSYPSQFEYWMETLYVKKNGEYFIHGKGGPLSRYAESEGNGWHSGEDIIPLSYIQARDWAENNLDADTYMELFEVSDNTDTGEAACRNIFMTDDIWDMAKADAKANSLSLSSYLSSLINEKHIASHVK